MKKIIVCDFKIYCVIVYGSRSCWFDGHIPFFFFFSSLGIISKSKDIKRRGTANSLI
jgi:uncharacterized protein YifN (PemK superfamily)